MGLILGARGASIAFSDLLVALFTGRAETGRQQSRLRRESLSTLSVRLYEEMPCGSFVALWGH